MTEAAALPEIETVILSPAEMHDSVIPNYREHFGDLTEMAASMTKHGVLQMPIVRPRPKGKGYELVFGYKRRAAAKLAKLAQVRCEVRQMSDDQVVEARLVENLQRTDPHPMDEARCLQGMIQDRGYTVETIAEKTGKPTRYIRERLQLCQLSAKCQRALDADQLTIGAANMIARVPPKLQDEALKEALADSGSDGMLTSKQVGELVRDRYMLKLADAQFDRADPNLVKQAGACVVCPKRTGNQTELFDDVKSPDVCTDPDCFREKNTAHFRQVAAGAKESGVNILGAGVAKKVFNQYGHGLNGGSEFELLDGERYHYDHKTHKRQHLKVKKLVGPDAEITLAQNPYTGLIVKLVGKKAVEAAFRKATKQKPEGSSKKRKPSAKDQAKREADIAKGKAREQINEALIEQLVANAEGSALVSVAAAPLRLLVKGLLECFADSNKLCIRRGIGPEVKPKESFGVRGKRDRELDKLVEKAGADWLWGVAFELLAWDAVDRDYGPRANNFEQLLKAFGVDRKPIEREVMKVLDLAKKVAAEAPAPAAPKTRTKPKKKPAKKRRAKR